METRICSATQGPHSEVVPRPFWRLASKSCDEWKGSFARGCEAKRGSHWTCASLGTIFQPMRINSVPDVKCFCDNKNVLRAQSMVWHFVRHVYIQEYHGRLETCCSEKEIRYYSSRKILNFLTFLFFTKFSTLPHLLSRSSWMQYSHKQELDFQLSRRLSQAGVFCGFLWFLYSVVCIKSRSKLTHLL